MSGTVVGPHRAFENLQNNGHIDGPVFREWVPLTSLIEKIPPRFHHGFVSKELVLTCVAVSCDSIVLGSNAGVLFWFSRSNHSVRRKSVDDKFIPVTAVSIALCQYGEILAAGNLQGTVAVFPSNSVQPLPVSVFNGEHKSPITSLSWDGSGVHLISGDEEGRVFLSKYDHNTIQPMRQILLEPSSIVQLRFHPLESNIVLVSSLKRALIANIGTPETGLNQIGQQDRKALAPFGADFGFSGNEAVIYSSRPGLRLWMSDCQGSVQQTLIFKESLPKPRSKLILLSVREEYSNGEAHFGPVYCLNNGLVLTYSPSGLFVLDTGQSGDQYGQVSVFCSSRFNPKAVRHATVFHNEIFVVLENRIVIRVSDRPDQSYIVPASSTTIERPLLSAWRDKLPVKPTFQSTINKLASKISDVDIKPLSAPVMNTGPNVIESLSNALAPLFDMKTLPINRCAPPKPIQPQFISSRTRTPSPSGETSSPIPQAHDRTRGIHRSAESNQQHESPLSNGSSGLASPVEGSISPGDDELVYGSYIGRKRKLKLNRKCNTLDESTVSTESSQTHLTPMAPQDSSIGNDDEAPNSSAPVTKDDFLEELRRKDQLLAELLQLDQLTNSQDESNATEERTRPTEETLQTPSSPPADEFKYPTSISDISTTSEDDGEVTHREPSENIYSIYANEEDPLDKSIPYSNPIPILSEPSLNQTVLSSGDFVKVSSNDVSEWMICPLDSKRKVTSVKASRHYVVIVYGNKHVYYQSTESTFEARDWLPIATPASQIAVSSSGQQLWRLYKGTAYQGLLVNPYCPFAQHWTALDSYISSIGIVQLDATDAMDDYIWMLHTNGSLSCRSVKSPKKMVLVEVPGTVAQLCCHSDRVFILLANGVLYSRSRVTFDSPMGVAWQRQEAPGELITIALSPSHYLWALNQSEQMFFRAPSDKRWWQVSVLPAELQIKGANWLNVSSLFKRQSSRYELAVTESRICLAFIGSAVLVTSQNVSGYAWDKVTWTDSRYNVSLETWRIINTNSFNSDDRSGIIWLLDTKNRLFCSFGDQLEQISLPTESPIRHLSVIGNHLWLLTTHGKIFVRVANSNPIGSGWINLSTAQFQSSNRLCYVSLGPEVAWACDQYGQIYFRSGDNGPPTLLAPAWIAIEEQNISFREIHVAPNLSVWALDNDGNIYIRENVTPELPIGTCWTLVKGVQAMQIAVSESAVWVLSHSGSIYRRGGITHRNSSGNSWDEIPGSFAFITVTIDDKLWVLDSSGVVHQLLTLSPFKNGEAKRRDEVLHVDEDWVLL